MTQIQPRPVSDLQLQKAVTDELRWTPSVDGSRIGVSVEQGAVTLSGTVDSYPQRRLAEQTALRVRGVAAVAEEITVHTASSTRTDADIALEAVEALERAIDVPGTVRAVVNSHHITLSGEVSWQYQRKAAERAVRYVRGVFGVSDAMHLKPTARPEQLEASITAAIVRNAQLDGRNITVATDGGLVRLEGHVQSWAERHQAETAAWSAPGVTEVANHLQFNTDPLWAAP